MGTTEKIPKWKELGYDAADEMYFSWWLDELKEAGLINNVVYHPTAFVLCDGIQRPIVVYKQLKTKIKEEVKMQTILGRHVYTPDFTFDCDGSDTTSQIQVKSLLDTFLLHKSNKYYIECKPSYMSNLKAREWALNQKWVWDKHSVYVNKVVCSELFAATFTPKLMLKEPDLIYVVGPNKGKTKIKWKIKTIEEWVKGLNM